MDGPLLRPEYFEGRFGDPTPALNFGVYECALSNDGERLAYLPAHRPRNTIRVVDLSSMTATEILLGGEETRVNQVVLGSRRHDLFVTAGLEGYWPEALVRIAVDTGEVREFWPAEPTAYRRLFFDHNLGALLYWRSVSVRPISGFEGDPYAIMPSAWRAFQRADESPQEDSASATVVWAPYSLARGGDGTLYSFVGSVLPGVLRSDGVEHWPFDSASARQSIGGAGWILPDPTASSASPIPLQLDGLGLPPDARFETADSIGSLVFSYSRHGAIKLAIVSPDGEVTALDSGPYVALGRPCISGDGAVVAVFAQPPRQRGEGPLEGPSVPLVWTSGSQWALEVLDFEPDVVSQQRLRWGRQ